MSEVLNPYIAGNPVTRTEMFFGRQDVFTFIRQALVGRHRDNVIVIYGQRRTGKTSVLYQMGRQLEARYVPIFIDLHGLELRGLNGFLWELPNHIQRILRREHKVELPRLDRAESVADPRGYFENEFLPQVWQAIGDRHLLLMLDEAIRLEEQVRSGAMEREVFDYLRYLMQHHERLNFLFSLGSGLEEMEKEYAFLFNVGLYKRISFLDRDSATALITEPVKDCYRVEPDAIERVLQITCGHPYYTQLLCHSLFNRWQQHPLPSVRARDVDAVLDQVVERGLAVLMHVWEESTPGEKAVMASAASAMGEGQRAVGEAHIERTWTRHGVQIPPGIMARSIKSLIAREIIAGEEKYGFTVELQRLWVRQYKRLEWVKEEIHDAVAEWHRVAEEVRPTVPASFKSRAAAWFIDYFILFPLNIAAPSAVRLMPGVQPAEMSALGNFLLASWELFAGYYVGFWYYIGFWMWRGQTPGKMLLKIKVVNADGTQLTFGRAALRYVATFLSTISFGLGYLWALRDPDGRGMHDWLARTRVVETKNRAG